MPKKTTKTKPRNRIQEVSAAPQEFGVRDAVDFLLTIPEISEAYTRADIELAIDDRGWERFSGTRNLADVDNQTRNLTINKCRLYWQKDPLAKQAVRLWTDYCLGNGISFKTKDTPAQAKLSAFVNDPRNRAIMSTAGQQRSSKQLLIDGDKFFALFDDGDGSKVIRQIETLQITDLITDPEDEERVLCYRRVTSKDKILYYADWTAGDDGKKLAEKQKDPQNGKAITLESDVVIKHVPFDNIGKRGNGLLSCVVDWSREHRRFMEARVSITQALAKFAYKLTAKGGQQVLNSIKTRLESSLSATGTAGGQERNPPPAPGSTWMQNAGMDMAPMPRATGGAEARDDSDGLKLMVSAGTNIMLHYFGDPSTGNLATATAMELPMLKSFNGYQKLWIDTWRDIFSIVLDEDPEAEPVVVDIDLPPILAANLGERGTFITQLTTAFPEAKVPAILETLLVAMGVNNLDEVMKAIADNKVIVDAKAEADREAQMLAGSAFGAVADQKKVAEAIHLLTEAFKGMTAAEAGS